MQYVRFGNSGMQVSRFCLGAMMFGSKMDAKEADRSVAEALDAGVNFIDTADSYGESEKILGEILSSDNRRERVFLATKVYKRFCRDQRVGRNSRINIINSLERSLRLLRTDYVDLYQLHHPDHDTPIMETLYTLDTLVKQGKIRYIGVSNHYAWHMAYMIGESNAYNLEPLVSLQANYNILDRQIENETVPFCNRFNIGLMCYGPLAGGILTGKYHTATGIPENSRGAGNSRMQSYIEDEDVKKIIKKMQSITSETGLKMNQLAILWLMAKKNATSIILGGSKPEHFTQIYDIADQDIPADALSAIDDLSARRVYTKFRNQPVREGPALAEQR